MSAPMILDGRDAPGVTIRIDEIKAAVIKFVQGLSAAFDPASIQVVNTGSVVGGGRWRYVRDIYVIDLEKAGLYCNTNPDSLELAFCQAWQFGGPPPGYTNPGISVGEGERQWKTFQTAGELQQALPTLGLVHAPGAIAARRQKRENDAKAAEARQRDIKALRQACAGALISDDTIGSNLMAAILAKVGTQTTLANGDQNAVVDSLASAVRYWDEAALRRCATNALSQREAMGSEWCITAKMLLTRVDAVLE